MGDMKKLLTRFVFKIAQFFFKFVTIAAASERRQVSNLRFRARKGSAKKVVARLVMVFLQV